MASKRPLLLLLLEASFPSALFSLLTPAQHSGFASSQMPLFFVLPPLLASSPVNCKALASRSQRFWFPRCATQGWHRVALGESLLINE